MNHLLLSNSTPTAQNDVSSQIPPDERPSIDLNVSQSVNASYRKKRTHVANKFTETVKRLCNDNSVDTEGVMKLALQYLGLEDSNM